MSENDHNLRGISRLDQASSGTHGWQVRIQRKGVRYGRFFSDREWGGADEALKVAIHYRDKIIAHSDRLGPSGEFSGRSHRFAGRRNNSGVVGVSRISQTSAKGVTYCFWQASWTDRDGARRTVRYSVLKLGEDEAFRLACIAREEAMKKSD